ncbi:phage major capsid protein, partial [Acinetobacter baumannii]|nr:phage major capsid protein [Acinetobacter baumannii]
MPLLREEAEKLSNNQLVQGVVEEIIDRDDLFAILPFTQVNGKAYVYNREKTLGGAN